MGIASVRAKFRCTMVTSAFNDTLDDRRTVTECKCITTAQFSPVLGSEPFEQQEGHELVVSNGGRLSLQLTAIVPPLVPGKLHPAVHPEHEGTFAEGKDYMLSIEPVE